MKIMVSIKDNKPQSLPETVTQTVDLLAKNRGTVKIMPE